MKNILPFVDAYIRDGVLPDQPVPRQRRPKPRMTPTQVAAMRAHRKAARAKTLALATARAEKGAIQ